MTDSADDLLEQLLEAEDLVWRALVTGDAAADAEALDEAFLGVYPDGFSGKGAHVAQLAQGPTVARYRLTQARAMSLGPDHGLLAYRADYLRTGREGEEAMYVTSVWRRRGEGWVNVFSQDTPEGPAGATC